METHSNSNCNQPGERRFADRVVFLGLAIFVLLTSGCGQSGPSMAPAKGRVTLDGQPVSDAAVAFMPVGGGPMAVGKTNAQGVFVLETTNKTGAVVGEHTVSIIKLLETGYNEDGTIGPGGIKTQWLVPRKYSRAENSGLTATVGKGDAEHVFELSSK